MGGISLAVQCARGFIGAKSFLPELETQAYTSKSTSKGTPSGTPQEAKPVQHTSQCLG
jgi:hypothetical protein